MNHGLFHQLTDCLLYTSRQEKDTLWDETKRLFYPHNVYVDLSDRLYQVKKELLDQMSMDNL